MGRDCVVTHIHPVHINEVMVWAREYAAAMQELPGHDSLGDIVEGVLRAAHNIDDLAYPTLYLPPEGLQPADARIVARRAQGILREAGIKISVRYDDLSQKIVLVGTERSQAVFWQRGSRTMAMAL